MNLVLPELSLVLLMGASGSGKSSFAARHFGATEVISSDYCRGLVSNDENSQSASKEAFELLHYIVAKRLANGLLTVVDATNVQKEARAPLVALARKYHCLPVAIVLNMPEEVCLQRNSTRENRNFGGHVVRNHIVQLRRSLHRLKSEGFRYQYVLNSPQEVEQVSVTRQPLWNNLKHDHGPFDIIGDVHGCHEELCQLLGQLGYGADENGLWSHPQGRKVIFVGDLVDRGPGVVQVLRLAMDMVAAGHALCVAGNHDFKLQRSLSGKKVRVTHGLEMSLEQLSHETPEFRARVEKFLDGLISHYMLDDGKLVVAHAGMKEEYQGRGSGEIRSFALYGETTGETDEFGLPVRINWAREYRGRATVVYGHTPVPHAEWLNRTINIDTGCVFGGKLTALRWPEQEVVSVPAKMAYAETARPFLNPPGGLSAQQEEDNMLDMEDVTGKRFIETRLERNVLIREENSIAALEVMSRFAADPRWLIYLPPTMSPSETSKREDLLEYPEEAFAYYSTRGQNSVICQEKHMGSRAVVVLCQDTEVALKRFGVTTGESGIIYTRTGRRFFDDSALEAALLERVRQAMSRSGLWEELKTDWVCLDCELMPWSAKAQELLSRQYAPVATAARVSLEAATLALSAASGQGVDCADLLENFSRRREMAAAYANAFRHYCWEVKDVADLRLAPFHLLASEQQVHSERDHLWHMEILGKLCAAGDNCLLATPWRLVKLLDEADVLGAISWWEELTGRGGEGMVVKPVDFVARDESTLLQPAIKCRGREYLRIIYGPEYSALENLRRLRGRSLGAKRSLALREFSLGLESLHRFVNHEPLRRVHECVFGVLALESEAVDPRL